MRPFIDLDRTRDVRRASPPRRPAARRRRPDRARLGVRRRLVVSASAIVLLAACAGEEEPDPAPIEDGVDLDDTADDEDAVPDDDAAEDDDPADTEGDDPGDETEATDDEEEAAAPLQGEVSTEEASADADGHGMTVTDVRVAAHDGFDRVVLEVTGEGTPGYHVRYAPDGQPTSQGSGEPIEVAGDHALEVAVHGVALPPEADEEHWDETLAGPDGGVVAEIVSDTIFEGIHTFAVGTTDEVGYVVERLDDPDRIVIDLHHGA